MTPSTRYRAWRVRRRRRRDLAGLRPCRSCGHAWALHPWAFPESPSTCTACAQGLGSVGELCSLAVPLLPLETLGELDEVWGRVFMGKATPPETDAQLIRVGLDSFLAGVVNSSGGHTQDLLVGLADLLGELDECDPSDPVVTQTRWDVEATRSALRRARAAGYPR